MEMMTDLYMHFDDGLADEGGAEESPEWDEEVAASDASQIEERIGNGGEEQNTGKAHLADHFLHPKLGLVHQSLNRKSIQPKTISQATCHLLGNVSFHKGDELLVLLVIRLFSRKTGRSGHEIWRQLAQCGTSAPHERLQSNLENKVSPSD
jgi:hypothetical protein